MPSRRRIKPTFGDDNFATTLSLPFGFESLRRENIYYLDNYTILTVAGNTLQFINLSKGTVKSLPGQDLGGIGCICVHPERLCYIVCENAPVDPRVLVYEFPKNEVKHVLKGGAQQGFTCSAFNASGDKLVTVAMEPDYVITIWKWREASIVLRNKAFGADVFKVSFNPMNEGVLTTSGMGHIKFWTMAETFTGLKLQGQVGKFGRVEISDVVGHVNLPDGKVLSGSESGMLLLWEGNLIKCEVGRKDPDHPDQKRIPCHNGPVEVLYFLEGTMFLSAGYDGYMRYWALTEIDTAEASDADSCCQVSCLREVLVGEGVKIKGMCLSTNKDHWIVQDANGQLLRVPYLGMADMNGMSLPFEKLPAPRALLSFHAGPVTCVDATHTDHTCVTGGSDGTIRLFDYLKRVEHYRQKLSAGVTFLRFFPSSIDATGGMFYCGFENGCVRVFSRCVDGFDLISVCKPHSSAVTHISFDRAFKKAVTTSKDNTIFFFNFNGPNVPWEPIGYITLFDTPNCSTWQNEGTHIILGLKKGDIIRVEVPKVDPSNESFERKLKYEGLGYRQYMKKPDKVVVKKSMEDADPGEKEVEDDDDEEDEEENADKGPWSVTFVHQLGDKHGNTLLVGLDHPESCFEIFPTKWYPGTTKVPVDKYGQEIPGTVDEPLRNISWRGVVTTTLNSSQSGKFMFVGCRKGRLLIRPTYDIEKCYLGQQLHSGQTGQIMQTCASYDDKLLITAGNDGMVFVQPLLEANVPTNAVDLKLLPTHRSTVEDISAVNALSIEQQKIKDDVDRVRNSAESKKMSLRNKVLALQEKYVEILNENDRAPHGKKLSAEELTLDEEVIEILKRDNQKKVEEARLEYAWVTRKKEVAYQKLSEVMWNRVIMERITLFAFESKQSVSTFRTSHFNERQKNYIESVHELIKKEEARHHQAREENEADVNLEDGDEAEPTVVVEHRDPEDSKEGTRNPVAGVDSMTSGTELNLSLTGKGKKAQTGKSQLEKTEDRRRERQERAKGRAALEARKPDDDHEDPKDVAAITRAKKFMGDYSLKSDPDYEVPDKQKVTAERKTRQLILLEESLNTLRMDFNERFLGVRDLKKRLIVSINNDRARIGQINTLLNIDVPVEVLSLKPEEVPEQRLETNKEMLATFGKEAEKARLKAEALEKAKRGFGGDLAVAEDEAEKEETTSATTSMADARRSSTARRGGSRRGSTSISAKERMELEMRHRMDGIKLSELELEERSMEREALLFEKSRLQRKISKTISAFDDAVDDLRREKMKMEADLKMADMRVQLLYQELRLLNDFKKRDGELAKKLEEKRQERDEVVIKIQACIDKLNDKYPEVELMDARGNEILEQCKALIADQPADKFLYKLFKRKIKNRRKKGGDDDDDESESSEDEMDEEEEEDDGLPPLENETCPDNCEEEVFLAVLELREQRLDQEDLYSDFIKSIDAMKKEIDSLNKKVKVVEGQLKQVEKEIAAFQNEKQHKLNQLETVVVLKARQMQCLTTNKRLPQNDAELVIFTNAGIKGLRQRINDLTTEKERLKKFFKELKREEVKITNQRLKLQAHVSDWEAKVQEVQLLKFGQKVDLDGLENVSVDRETENLKVRLKAEELKWEREITRVAVQVEEVRRQFQDVVNQNSALLTDFGNTRQDQQRIEEELNQSSGKVVTRMSGGSAVATESDQTNLKELVVVQQAELNSLKNEIAMLRRKGGHVYTPIVHKQGVATTSLADQGQAPAEAPAS